MCTWCGQTFTQSANMQKHIIQQHTLEKSHVCKLCGKSFVQPYYLKRHLLTHKDGPQVEEEIMSPEKKESIMSDECIGEFTLQQVIPKKRAVIVVFVLGVRTVPCMFCPATMKGQPQLRAHMERHHISELQTDINGHGNGITHLSIGVGACPPRRGLEGEPRSGLKF